MLPLSKISILISVLSAIGFIFVGFTPADILGKAHMFAVNLAFRSFLVVMFFYFPIKMIIQIWKSKRIHRMGTKVE